MSYNRREEDKKRRNKNKNDGSHKRKSNKKDISNIYDDDYGKHGKRYK